MPRTNFIKLRETTDHPETLVALRRLNLREAKPVLKQLYLISSLQTELEVISEEDIKRLQNLYNSLKERANNSRLDPNGYLGYIRQNESYKILEKLSLEVTEIDNFVRTLETLTQGIDQEIKVENEHGKKINPKILQYVFDDTIKGVGPYRAEHLNASFIRKGNQLYLIKRKLNQKGVLENITEELDEDALMKSKGINLRDLFRYRTKQGFPRKDIPDGNEISYLYPQDGAVVGVVANPDRAYFNCVKYPSVSSKGLGARAQKIKYTK